MKRLIGISIMILCLFGVAAVPAPAEEAPGQPSPAPSQPAAPAAAAPTPAAAASAPSAPVTQKALDDLKSSLQVGADTAWVLFTAFLVFFMNLGFAMVESGLCRAKNAVNILAKNFIVFAIASASFWFIGWGLMFGNDNPFLGLEGLFFFQPKRERRCAMFRMSLVRDNWMMNIAMSLSAPSSVWAATGSAEAVRS